VSAFLAGVVAGYGIAIPVGAVGAYLVALTARTSFRVGGAAALGVATADGVYATAAVLGGAALASTVTGISEPLRWLAAGVLLALAARMAYTALREHRAPSAASAAGRLVDRPRNAYVVMLGATLLNPATVVYFAALVVGNQGARVADAPALFVAGAVLSSASWQLLLAGGGAAFGRAVTAPRGRLLLGLGSAVLVGALAGWTVTGG
jgi:arginine exporter protein ArgO